MYYFQTKKLKRKILTLLIFVVTFSFHTHALAQTMTSTNYVILSNSLDCGGGTGTSASYALTDSICETAPGDSTNSVFSASTNYTIGTGFQAMDDIPHITVSFSDPDSNNGANTVAFGTLTTSAVAQDQIGVTVTTNAVTGYSATLIANNAFRRASPNTAQKIGNVSDGAVTTGISEYGFCATGTDGQFACNTAETCVPYSGADSDSPVCTTVAKEFARKTTWASGVLTTLTFKAAISSTVYAGSDYTQTMTIIVSGTF